MYDYDCFEPDRAYIRKDMAELYANKLNGEYTPFYHVDEIELFE